MTAILAVYDLRTKVRHQLKQIVDSKDELEEDELRKRVTILSTRLYMPECTFIMKDFKKHKTRGIEWFGEPFYSSPRGYKLCLNVDANGYEEARGSYVSVWVYLMWGENDDVLNFPPTGNIHVEVESNSWPYDNITETISLHKFKRAVESGEKSEWAHGEPFFLKHDKLRYYLNDNKMEFKVTFSRDN